MYFTWLYDSEIINKNPTVQIRAYKHSRKPKSEIKDVDFNKILKCLDLTSLDEYRDYVVLQLLMDMEVRIDTYFFIM